MDEESTDNKKIKTDDEKLTELNESEPTISAKEVSSKKNVSY